MDRRILRYAAWRVACVLCLAAGARTAAARPPVVDVPFVLYRDADDPDTPPYTTTGWMGNLNAVGLDPECTDDPYSGETCIEATYRSDVSWGGVAWLDPADNWGRFDGGYDLGNARELTFWARGRNGGELVEFKIGIKQPGSAEFKDTALVTTGKVKLTTKWRKYRVVFGDVDLSRVISGFVWVVEGQGEPITFYLDDIQYE